MNVHSLDETGAPTNVHSIDEIGAPTNVHSRDESGTPTTVCSIDEIGASTNVHTCQPIHFTSIKYIFSLFWGDMAIWENGYRKTQFS